MWAERSRVRGVNLVAADGPVRKEGMEQREDSCAPHLLELGVESAEMWGLELLKAQTWVWLRCGKMPSETAE